MKKNKLNKIKVGDVISVHYEYRSGHWKSKKFTGICISAKKTSYGMGCTLRNVIQGVSVEFSFDFNSPLIISLKKHATVKLNKIRKSKLYYLRKQKLINSKVFF